jgi:hypothetical protein
MRYARPSCDQYIRLAAEYAALFQDYVDAKDALVLTRKNDPRSLSGASIWSE